MTNLEEKSQPSENQIREFWEWCGFEHLPCSQITRERCWVDPIEGDHTKERPPIDLNNLFKYAVPKLRYADIIKPDGKDTYGASVRNGEGIVGKQGYNFDNEDPALALFWAIYEVIK